MSKRDYPENRKNPVRLSNDEEYAVYKYCIEHHCLRQIEDLFAFRVQPTEIAREINSTYSKMVAGREINAHHVKTAVDRVIAWQQRLGKEIIPQETVEMEMLREDNTRKTRQIEELKVSCENGDKALKAAQKEIERLNSEGALQKLTRIRAIVSV